MRRGNCGAVIGVCALGLGLGIADVPGGVSADRLRDRMLKGREVKTMKIVIWKAPRCLRGLLRRMFGIRE